MMGWQLHDGVTIAAEGNFPALQGIIAYVEGDTIGVRLTGESEGMGDHSGSVDGIDYFDCPLNSGVLTTTAKITRRRLSYAEEARLRRDLQPTTPRAPPASMSLSGLSPAALARMAQLQQRMQADSKPQQAPPNRLPPSATKAPIESREPALEDEKEKQQKEEQQASEKRLSRLELLRQRKEAIRQKKLALQEKVQENKDKQIQKEEGESERAPADQPVPMEEEPQSSAAPATEERKEDAPIKAAPPSSPTPSLKVDARPKVQRKKSQDSLEELWVKELRHESPPAAAKYDGIYPLEDDKEAGNVSPVREILQQPSLEHEQNDEELVDAGEEEEVGKTPFSQRMSRLQQLRQKKRLLEALPASISTNAPGPDAELHMNQPSAHSRSLTPPPPTLDTTSNLSPPVAPNNLASMAMASAAALANDDDDNSSRASTLSTQMSEMDLEDNVHQDFQESVTITAGTSNPLRSVPSQDSAPVPFDESPPKPPASTMTGEEEEMEEEDGHRNLKRRRMLGLGFLPTNRRMQKRRDTGQTKEGHQ